MAVQVKVCGITRREDAELALSLGAGFIGVIVAPQSPRAVAAGLIPQLLEVVPRGRRVLVDVAPEASRLREFMAMGFDACQIHFDLDAPMSAVGAWCAEAGQEALWLAPRIPPDEPGFPQVLLEFADTIVLDAYDRRAFGGTGRAGQNWQRYTDCSVLYQHKRWILAGGLSPDNVLEALEATQAAFIDVNSGVESAPGIKDPEKLRRLFARIRQG